ncbi:hypothetical protein STEG23_011851 [Scotinomys teguina]
MMFDGPKSGGCDDGGIKAGSLWHPTKAPLGQSEDVAADADRANSITKQSPMLSPDTRSVYQGAAAEEPCV